MSRQEGVPECLGHEACMTHEACPPPPGPPYTPLPQNCTLAIFFEVRKRKDLYIWMSKVPGGPSVKFYVTNSESSSMSLTVS